MAVPVAAAIAANVGQGGVMRLIKLAAIAALAAAALAVIALVALIVMISRPADAVGAAGEGAAGWGYPAGSDLPPAYWPMYVGAAARYSVSPYLLASIHKQETGFSTAPSAKQGLNAFGCCGGPMQFKPSTWASHERAFVPLVAQRPATYPLDRRSLPSCRAVPADRGCMYDDFDAIAGAAHKLAADGADTSLYSEGTRLAVCAYIGSCAEVARCTGSVNEYCAVIPRAREWERRGGGATAGSVPGVKARLLPNGLAVAPAAAPPAVKQMIAAANAISDTPYELVHYPTHIGNPTYDCSSSTSHVLWAGGKFGVAPVCSSVFATYGDDGPGKWVTVYSRGPCGASGHVFLVIAGLRFDTSPNSDIGPNARESGPRWRTLRPDLGAFIDRHPEGL